MQDLLSVTTGHTRAPGLVAAALVALLAAAPASAAGPQTLSLVADTWCPVSCATTDKLPGYAVEITREIYTAAGYRVQYLTEPWARAVVDVREGRHQVLIGVSSDESPDELLFPREPVAINVNAFFVRKADPWQYRGIESLAKAIVGVANDYVFGEPFDSYSATHRANARRIHVLVAEDPVTQGIALLRMKRIDSYLDDRTVVRWTTGAGRLPADLREAGELSRFPLYVAFPRKDARAAQWAKTFDDGIRQMRASGALKRLLARYGVSDWKK